MKLISKLETKDLMEYLLSKCGDITEARAIAGSPLYAERQQRRSMREDGSELVGSSRWLDDYFTMEMWDEERAIYDSYKPWYYKALLHYHWWASDYGVRPLGRKAKWFYQRGKRGWSDYDTWGLSNHLSRVIAGSVAELRKHAHGWPCSDEIPTFEDWMQILDEIVVGMEASELIYNDETDDRREELEASFALAMQHLTKHWHSLWD